MPARQLSTRRTTTTLGLSLPCDFTFSPNNWLGGQCQTNGSPSFSLKPKALSIQHLWWQFAPIWRSRRICEQIESQGVSMWGCRWDFHEGLYTTRQYDATLYGSFRKVSIPGAVQSQPKGCSCLCAQTVSCPHDNSRRLWLWTYWSPAIFPRSGINGLPPVPEPEQVSGFSTVYYRPRRYDCRRNTLKHAGQGRLASRQRHT